MSGYLYILIKAEWFAVLTKNKRMIYKNMKYGKVDGVTIVTLGEGDVRVTTSELSPVNTVHLTLTGVHEKHPIGICQTENFDEVMPDIVFIFNNKDSMDVLINSLVDCKKRFTE